MPASRLRQLLAPAVAVALVCATYGPPAPAAATGSPAAQARNAQADSALAQGKALLRRDLADEALPQFEQALALFTQAGDALRAAEARDGIGDIFLRQGQQAIAASHFEQAYTAFCGARQQANANLMLAKLGEAKYLGGDPEGARAAFARMNQCGGNGAAGAAGGDARRRNGAAFIPAGAALSLASCPAFSPSGPPNSPAQPPANEPTLGHGPTERNRTVRMDLRVVDEQGNPVGGARAKLESERQSNGFLCDCTHDTDALGKVLMDPIHFTKTLKLAVKARGYEPLLTQVDPASLNQPYRVVMRKVGDAANGAANQQQPAQSAQSAASCFDLYSLFVSYVLGEFGQARSDYDAGRLAAARTHYENVLAVSNDGTPAGSLQAARLFRAVARTNLGDIALREGRAGDAAGLYRLAVEGARRDGRPELVWAAQRGLARALWSQSASAANPAAAARARADALASYRDALSTVETLLAGGLRGDEARANFLATTRDLFDEAVGAFAESALSGAPAGGAAVAGGESLAHAAPQPRPLEGHALALAAEAFRASEQGRARALLDLIGETRARITEGVPADLLARRTDNRARQQEIADALRGVRAAGAQTPKETVAQLEAELGRLAVESVSLENQIRVASPRYNALVRQQPLSLAEVQQQVLDDSTALLEYELGRERSYLFVVTKAGLSLFRLPARQSVEAQVVALREQLVPPGSRRPIAGDAADAQRGIAAELEAAAAGRGLVLGGPAVAPQVVQAYAGAARSLYDTAVAPAAAAFGDRRLLVVAEGALNYVPFEALVTRPGGADYSSLSYLVGEREIVYAPSASVVAALRQARAAAAAARGLLVVADPVFDAADPRTRGRQLKPSPAGAQRAAMQSAIADVSRLKAPQLRLVRLDGTRSEGERIAELARAGGDAADVWLDFDASEANLRRRDLSRYRVLHVATHGLLDSERPQFSGLALTLVGDPESDGFLRTDEVFNLRLGAQLVMLSACETALGKEKRGEGVIGLTRAFMYAGAPTVGVSLWSVADRSTAELMPDFYKRFFATRGGAPAAMRGAQQQMIAGKRYSAPFYWAPFVLVGDWK